MPRRVIQSRSVTPHPSESESDAPSLNADTSPTDLLNYARKAQAAKNAARAQSQHLSRKLADITNGNVNDTGSGHKSKRRKVTVEPPSESSDDENDNTSSNQASEQFVLQAGQKFFLVYGPWIRSHEDIFDTDLDEKYDAAERFENDANKLQGQLREVLHLLPKFQERDLGLRWIQRQFMNGLNNQHYNTSTRIRHNCASILGISDSDLLKSDVRKAKFRKDIGWVDNAGVYSSVDVPILHRDWHGEYSLSSIFLNTKLMGIYVALIRSPRSSRLFMNGQVHHPHTETMARIHNIRNITPGAIATCSILACWALSADDTLQEVGSCTGIQYFRDFEEYLTILETGVRQKKKSVLNIIKAWDEKIFPDYDARGGKSTESSGLKKAMVSLANDSLEEEDELNE